MKVLSESEENQLLEDLYNSYFNTKRETEETAQRQPFTTVATKEPLSLVDDVLFDHAEMS